MAIFYLMNGIKTDDGYTLFSVAFVPLLLTIDIHLLIIALSLFGLLSSLLLRILRTSRGKLLVHAPKARERFLHRLFFGSLAPWHLMYLTGYMDSTYSLIHPSRQLGIHMLWFFSAVLNWVLWALVVFLSIISISFGLQNIINLGYVAYGAGEHVIRNSIPLTVSSILAIIFLRIWWHSLMESMADHRTLAAGSKALSAATEGLSLWPYRKAALTSLVSMLLQIPFFILFFLMNLGPGV